MHLSALENADRFFKTYAHGLSDGTVVDIGAQNFNGSIADVCPKRFKYVGVDFVSGNGVDIVLDDPYKLPFGDATVDMVVANSTFEHSEMFWLMFLEILRVLKPSGLFYLNAPSNGPFHRYPVDCWRFYPDCGGALVNWARRNRYDALLLESYTSRQHLDVFNDFVAIFLKSETQLALYPDRIVHKLDGFTNAVVHGEPGLIRETDFPEDQRKFHLRVKRNFWRLLRSQRFFKRAPDPKG